MASDSVQMLFKNFWAWRMMEFPEFATFVGIHTHDGHLQSYSLKSVENRKIAVEKFLKEASELLKDSKLSSEDKSDITFFISDLNVFLKGLNAKGYFFPLSYLDGVHIEFERLLTTMKQETETDYIKILQRLQELPSQIAEIIEVMREGIGNKMTFHSISISRVLKQLDLLQQEPEDSIFFKPFLSIQEDFSFRESTKSEVINQAKAIIKEKVLQAFKDLKHFLEKEYLKHLRPDIAITSLNNGKEFYQMCLDYHLTYTMTPEEVHEIGRKEVERINKKMKKIIESLELKMSVQDFSEHMRKVNDFSFENVEELLEAYKGAIHKQIEPKLSKLFKYTPKSKLVIELTPPSTPNAPGASYYAGTVDGSKPGTLILNATDLKTNFKYDVMSLSLHEAMPGHHLQMSFMIENENIPDFRRFVEDRRYIEAPSLFPLHTAYVEGWGLYSEDLGYELGLYDDIYLEYGHLSQEMLRACRLVVDTGIHAFGWTRDNAIEYLLNHTALHRSGVENEIDRYITWPGQACGYKIGELKIKSLREQAEKALGLKFDVREFHDVILQSFGPLHLLEKRVLDYIQQSNS